MQKKSKKLIALVATLLILSGCTMGRLKTSEMQLQTVADVELGKMLMPITVCTPTPTPTPTLVPTPTPTPTPTLTPTPTPIPDCYVTIASIGDIMCHETNFREAYVKESNTYDFSSYFTYISDYLLQADLAIGNLETTFAGKERGYSGYPSFNTPDELGQSLNDMGIDVLGTTNNHSLDKGYQGVERTLDVLDKLEIAHTGTARSEEEQDSILIKEVNGIKIAFLAYSYGTNGIKVPKGKEYCVNLIDKAFILEQIDKAKKLGVDVICVNMHWGVEYQTSHNAEQESLAKWLIANGVDIIFGSHSHVLQEMERLTVETEKGTREGFVIYSQGNFISNMTKVNTKDTTIVNIQLKKSGETGKISIEKVEYIPMYLYNENFKNYKLLDLNEIIRSYEEKEGIWSEKMYKLAKEEKERCDKIIDFEE